MRQTAVTLLAVLALLTGCGYKEKAVPFEEVNIASLEMDTMIYGFCSRGSTADMLHLITDGGDTLRLDTRTAAQDSMIIGGYDVGDELAVTVNADTTAITMLVNRTALQGEWMLPNPIDGDSYMGISIRKGGTLESIDQSMVIYKSWRLFNGKLVFVLSREDGIGNDEEMMYNIVRLTPDSLILTGDDEILEYGRQDLDDDDDIGIELDDGMDDFFL